MPYVYDPPLKSAAEEKADCLAACKDAKVGDRMNFLHHAIVEEVLTEPVENRIECIWNSKNQSELAQRFRHLRPAKRDAILEADAALSKAGAAL